MGPDGRHLVSHRTWLTRTVLEWLCVIFHFLKQYLPLEKSPILFLSFWAKQLCTHTALWRATSVLDAATGRILFHKYHRRPGFSFQNANLCWSG